MENNTDKSHEKFRLQLENLNSAIVHYFNEDFPLFIDDANGNKQKVNVKYNVGETWEQVSEIETQQSKGDFIIQKPIATLRSVGIEPIKEWNRLPKHIITLDKQIFKNPETRKRDFIPKTNAVPVYEYTLMRYPTHYRRMYRLSLWTDYVVNQDNLIESLMATLMASNTIMVKSEQYNTLGFMTNMTDDNNFDKRSDDLRTLKNYIDFEFEGYLVSPDSIFKRRTYSHVKITEEIVKN